MFLTCAEQARVDFRMHTPHRDETTTTAYTKLSTNYFFQQQFLPVEHASPASNFKTTCKGALCQTAPDLWALTIHVSSRESLGLKLRMHTQYAQGLDNDSVLVSNASFVSGSSVRTSRWCSNGPVKVMIRENSNCAALIFDFRTMPCGLEAVVLGAQGCPPQQVLTTSMPALLGSRRYQDMCESFQPNLCRCCYLYIASSDTCYSRCNLNDSVSLAIKQQ